ncbi:S-type anion channel SLAH2-like [Olea europaea subsp. europaea]|uniref:S-type anion channel SLAH2-like n=2 Tax=Olea europaea subsp. europaea TaxID=158383 RepID=A0A8S0S8E6_OLEEU|nr:S-type anion channel SLAH2-like [Olea europaea subsp. europaea]
MEYDKHNHLARESSEVLPSPIKVITAQEVPGFDAVKQHDDVNDRFKSNGLHLSNSSITGTETVGVEGQNDLSKSQKMHFVAISMPSSPVGVHLHNTKKGLVGYSNEAIFDNDIMGFAVTSKNRQTTFYSLPILKCHVLYEAIASGKSPYDPDLPPRFPRVDVIEDKRFDSFKTWSGKLEGQILNLCENHRETEQELETHEPAEVEILPADRYFDALEGLELDTLKASEEVLLPEDKKWPFLLRFPISSFGICLGVSSHAIMWKALATSASTGFLRVNLDINLVLWFISVSLMAVVSFIYCLKVIFYFEAVRREYYHPIRVNFFFAPWITLLFLALGVPPSISQNLHESLWYILMTPIFCLELKIYGQWMSGGQQRLSMVANPSNHLSIIGNFLGALLGASMGLKEGPIFFFAVGLAHYLVLFVTLYQRLPTTKTLPKELHPVFFLFVAAPSIASMAWGRIQGSFDSGARIAYFIALFLYFSLAVRVNFFRGFRFSLAWWAYTFPMTGAAIATIRYSTVVTNVVTKSLTIVLCTVATLAVASLLVTTIIHAFVLGDLFPNDISIAISETRPKPTWKWNQRTNGSPANKESSNF